MPIFFWNAIREKHETTYAMHAEKILEMPHEEAWKYKR